MVTRVLYFETHTPVIENLVDELGQRQSVLQQKKQISEWTQKSE